MSFNIFRTLKEMVSPIALEQEKDDLLYKKHALMDFYPILLSIISAKPELFDSLSSSLNPKLSDLFEDNFEITQQFLNYLSGEASTAETYHVVNRAIAPTLNFLVSEAGSNDIQVILHTLKSYRTSIVQALPYWAPDLLKLVGVNIEPKQLLQSSPLYPDRKYRLTNLFQWGLMVVLTVTLFFLVNALIHDEFDINPQVKNIETMDEIHPDLQKNLNR